MKIKAARLWVVLLLAAPVLTGATIPLEFEANRGQGPPQARFIAQTGSQHVYFSDNAVEWGDVRMRFAGANRRSHIRAELPLPGISNYFAGRDPAHWLTAIPHYGKLRYRNVYTGIGAVFYAVGSRLEYDFLLAPGADPERLALRFDCGCGLRIEDGELVIGDLRQHRPRAWQGSREIATDYRIDRDGTVRFRLGPHDAARSLLIDPVLSYVTYANPPGAVAVDSAGNAYITGSGPSVTKLSPDGGTILYSTVLGQAPPQNFVDCTRACQVGSGIAVDPDGSVYFAGTSTYGSFPTTPGAYMTDGGPGFVAKLSPAGDRLIYSTRIPPAVAALAAWNGTAYVIGTDTGNLPVTAGAAQSNFGGGRDAYVIRVNADGTGLIYATYLGGSGDDRGKAIAVDSEGNAYITGNTLSADFPTTPGAAQRTFGGSPAQPAFNYGDAFVAKLNPLGTAILYSTYLGGKAADVPNGITADQNGDAIVVGNTGSSDFPTTGDALQPAYAGPSCCDGAPGSGFITRLNATGGLAYSTYFGGAGYDVLYAVAVDATGSMYVAGGFASSLVPVDQDAIPYCHSALAGPGPQNFANVAQLSASGRTVLHATALPGMNGGGAGGIAVGPDGQVYVWGGTGSSAFFATPGAARTTVSNGFLAKLDLSHSMAHFIACVMNAASLEAGNDPYHPDGAVVPGEIVSLFGIGAGPETPVVSAGVVTNNLGGTRLLFDGVPAPLLYVSAKQVNAIVPYAVAAPTTKLSLERDGMVVYGPIELPVIAAVPGVFMDTVRHAAALNQDGTVNSPSNPAAQGSVVQIFWTGAGQTNPAGVDGSINPLSPLWPVPARMVTASVEGTQAPVLYAGAAPGLVSGAEQVNIQVPQLLITGQVQVRLTVGDFTSPTYVYIAVR